MAAKSDAENAPLALICGDDEFAVKERAAQLFHQWCEASGGMDHETIDGQAGLVGEVLKVISQVHEALQTLPFFGGSKVVWLKNCTFLGEEKVSTGAGVTDALAGLAQVLKEFRWEGVRLLVSAGKVDKRKVFYKTINSIGAVEVCAGWSLEQRDWAEQAEDWAARQFKERKKRISEEALAQLVSCVGPNPRQLASEIEKLELYLGDRDQITLEDVDVITTRNKQAQAFALGDALGDRNLPRLLKVLDEELWTMKVDSKRSEIGLLYGLITKVRVLLFAKEMIRAGLVKAAGQYNSFKAQLGKIPADLFPNDPRINPLSVNPYVLFRGAQQSGNYTSEELVKAMDLLLDCNRRLVSTQGDDAMILQQALTQIVKGSNLGKSSRTPVYGRAA